MNKQELKRKVIVILLQLHRGFLTEEVSDTLTDKEILAMLPPNGVSRSGTGMKLTPFTEKWVRKQVKKNPDITSLEMLKSVGFVDE